MARPVGVTILAILAILGALSGLFFALLFLLGMRFLVRETGMPHYMASLVPMVATSGITVAIVDIVIAFGLLTLANWGRVLTMICAGLSLLAAVAGTVRLLMRADLFPLPREIVIGTVGILVLWYLSRPHVKRAFSSASRVARPPAASGTPPQPLSKDCLG